MGAINGVRIVVYQKVGMRVALVREFVCNIQPYNKSADYVAATVQGVRIEIVENIVADALALSDNNAPGTSTEPNGWMKSLQHIMKEDHFTKDQGFSIVKSEPTYTTRLFAINETLILKKKLTYASLELLVIITRVEKASGRVDWTKLVFSNFKRELNAINRGQVTSSKCVPILTHIIHNWLRNTPIAVHKEI